MITVCCVRQGEAFGVEYVERLHDMVRRNLPAGFSGRFVCFTDRPEDLAGLAGVEVAELSGLLLGWWAKMELFASPIFEPNERVWYFDLDTVITGPLEKLFQYPGAFGLLEDVYRPRFFQSSVMSWIAGTPLVRSIWEEWVNRDCPKPPGGDQAVLEMFWMGPESWLAKRIKGAPWPPDFLQEYAPGVLRSYKVECVWTIPKGTSVVFFHGTPRPHEVRTGWVPEVWKVGGGSSVELVLVGTVAQERVLQNIARNMEQGFAQLAATEPHGQLALICGGSPSLKDHLMLLRSLQRGGAMIFAVNQVDGYMREHGIYPNFHIMLDAREDLAQWVNPKGVKLYASMCDPATLQRADDLGDLVIWHSQTEGIDRVLGKAMLIGGGSTVGVHAMVLAYVMGFRRIHCFGMDSSYTKGEHHAYPQALNDGERVLDAVVGGKRFKCAPWMVQQADDWKETAVQLSHLGCEIAVFSEGLIGAVAASMREQTVEVDGLHWPSHDVETRKSVLGTRADLEHYVSLCAARRVAIQAGGNVGVWPKELAKHFDVVHTFEPDVENWACLVKNVTEPNIRCYPQALGAMAGHASIERQPGNCGASALGHREENDVPVITIDGLGLTDVDLIQLDVEGFELQALHGGVETIRRCSPLIVLELKGLGERYGYADHEVEELLLSLGYARIGVAHRDVIYQRTLTQ